MNFCNAYAAPPDDGCETEEDSGEEDYVEMNNLPRSHILTNAIIAEVIVKMLLKLNKDLLNHKKHLKPGSGVIQIYHTYQTRGSVPTNLHQHKSHVPLMKYLICLLMGK